ncbi:hypothetical protein [Pseudomonas antarctica]|nr:hypothetical protein [Pseudomonas antarctica]
MERGWVQLELRAQPKRENVAVYDQAFAAYLTLYPALKPIMHSLQNN